MSLFLTPEEHAVNPPETWKVMKLAPRLWALQTQDDVTLDTRTTKRDAESLKTSGAAFNLYETERRWYEGAQVPQWRQWADVRAEQLRNVERWPEGPLAKDLATSRERVTAAIAAGRVSGIKLSRPVAEQLLEPMKADVDGCDHSVGICNCSAADAIEELSAAIDGREPWWVALDRLQPADD